MVLCCNARKAVQTLGRGQGGVKHGVAVLQEHAAKQPHTTCLPKSAPPPTRAIVFAAPALPALTLPATARPLVRIAVCPLAAARTRFRTSLTVLPVATLPLAARPLCLADGGMLCTDVAAARPFPSTALDTLAATL